MKRFTFRLDRIKRIRFLARREAEGALAQAVAQARAIRCTAEELERCADESAAESMARIDRGDRVDGKVVRERADEVQALRAVALRRRSELALVLERVSVCEQVFHDRNRGYKVLEKLRESKKRDWVVEANREEQHELDELYRARIKKDMEEKRVS